MNPGIQISITDGSLNLSDTQIVIRRGMSQASAESMLSEFRRGAVDHGNGYSWSYFNGLALGGKPSGIALGFHKFMLTEVHLGVALTAVKLEGGWPTREDIDDEIAFVRMVFSQQLSRKFGDRPEKFKWGVAWSGFDPKGFQATAVIRYG